MKNEFVSKILIWVFLSLFGVWSMLKMITAPDADNLVEILLTFFCVYMYIKYCRRTRFLTSQKKFYLELTKNLNKYSRNIIIVQDTDLNIIDGNDLLCKFFDVKRVEDISEDVRKKTLSREKFLEIKNYEKQALETGKNVEYNFSVDNEFFGKKYYESLIIPLKKEEEIYGLLTISRDVSLLEILKSKSAERQARLSFIINNVPMPAYLMDNNGKYLQGNLKFNKLLGTNPVELLGSDITCIFNNIAADELREENARVITEKRTIVNEHSYRIFNNPEMWFRVYKTPIMDNDGSVVSIAVFMENISAEKELKIQKKRFMATLNHDLKTPVIAQIRSLEMILKGTFGEVNSSQREILELTINSCDNIYNMVSTIISSYKLENNEIKLNYAGINFNGLVMECCEIMQNAADEKNIEFIIKPCSYNNLITADSSYLKTAVIFLLENSISYAYHDSKIEICINNDGNNLTFEIITQSPFIPEDTLNTMLHQYMGQISNYNKIGFCMKLNYCNQVIKAHNGHIIAESKLSNENKLGFQMPVLLVSTESFQYN